MDIRSKILASKFKNNSYALDLENYIKDMVSNERLSYEQLEYIYQNLYNGKSDFIKQNIYPVTEFLVKGYTPEEAEEIAKILPDAHKETIFSNRENERGDKYNKMFYDLGYSYYNYDEYRRLGHSAEKSLEFVKELLKISLIEQRRIEMKINDNQIYDIKEIDAEYKNITQNMEKLQELFELETKNDPNLIEYFKEKQEPFWKIIIAGTIVAGIHLRNIKNEEEKIELEKNPYNEKQIDMINRYSMLEETKEKMERYVDLYIVEEEEEEEIEM